MCELVQDGQTQQHHHYTQTHTLSSGSLTAGTSGIRLSVSTGVKHETQQMGLFPEKVYCSIVHNLHATYFMTLNVTLEG